VFASSPSFSHLWTWCSASDDIPLHRLKFKETHDKIEGSPDLKNGDRRRCTDRSLGMDVLRGCYGQHDFACVLECAEAFQLSGNDSPPPPQGCHPWVVEGRWRSAQLASWWHRGLRHSTKISSIRAMRSLFWTRLKQIAAWAPNPDHGLRFLKLGPEPRFLSSCYVCVSPCLLHSAEGT